MRFGFVEGINIQRKDDPFKIFALDFNGGIHHFFEVDHGSSRSGKLEGTAV